MGATRASRRLRHSRLAGQPYRHVFGIGPHCFSARCPADEALRSPRCCPSSESLPGSAPRPGCCSRCSAASEELGLWPSRAASPPERSSSVDGRPARGAWSFIAEYEAATTRRAHATDVACRCTEERGHRGVPLDARAQARPLALRAWPPRRGRAATHCSGASSATSEDRATQTLWRQAQALVHSRAAVSTQEAERLGPGGSRDRRSHGRLNAPGRARTRPGARSRAPAAPRRPPRRSSRRSTATSARRTWPWSRRRARAGGAPCPRVLAAGRRTPRAPGSAAAAARRSRPHPPRASSARRSPSSSATSPARRRWASRPTPKRCAPCSPATSSA